MWTWSFRTIGRKHFARMGSLTKEGQHRAARWVNGNPANQDIFGDSEPGGFENDGGEGVGDVAVAMKRPAAAMQYFYGWDAELSVHRHTDGKGGQEVTKESFCDAAANDMSPDVGTLGGRRRAHTST